MMDALLHIQGGPMDGQSFRAEFIAPPPPFLIGPEIHRALSGTYVRQSMTFGDTTSYRATYKLREDDDFARVKRGTDRYRVMRKLSEEMRG